uniref:Protein glass n=1 Tax=Parastrongyloides trichosuri TaxID=131310 RepID=A0A0N4ZGZ0_PARTI
MYSNTLEPFAFPQAPQAPQVSVNHFNSFSFIEQSNFLTSNHGYHQSPEHNHWLPNSYTSEMHSVPQCNGVTSGFENLIMPDAASFSNNPHLVLQNHRNVPIQMHTNTHIWNTQNTLPMNQFHLNNNVSYNPNPNFGIGRSNYTNTYNSKINHSIHVFQPNETSEKKVEEDINKLLSCPTCGKQYCRKSTLKAHMKQHFSGEKPFTCEVCGKSFSQAANLTAHRRVHTGEKPFTCKICSRAFSQSSSLTTHLRTHTHDRPYRCRHLHCEKAFTDSSTLTKHMRTHTGQKPYACGLCAMRFSQSGNLHRHMKTHKQ